ncbi:uncharacterized protein [Amphiura filiformis]|uniref:uncharacterized protein n=1 Tax=Amphiura filiformis TaxID=82378 RepID=UPI003B210874
MSTEEDMSVATESKHASHGWSLEQFTSSDYSDQKTGCRGTIGIELQRYLSLQSELRDDKQIKRILSMVRGIDVFSIFSSDMNDELGRRLAYERYDNGRVIAYQGRPPERLYYIISGKVTQLREYNLATGNFTKCVGVFTKGQFTETEELNRCCERRHNLVCKGSVEVLLLERKDYFFLLNTHSGPPVEFLRSHILFEDFPCALFLQHPDAIECRYYGPNKIVAADANDTKDIYIIKSGKCRCTRKQYVVDMKNNKALSDKKPIDKLGYVKPSSHADAMLDIHMKRSVARGMTRFNHKESAFVRHKETSALYDHLGTIKQTDVQDQTKNECQINGVGSKSSDYLNGITRKDDKDSLKESDVIQKRVGRSRRVSLAYFSMQSELLPPSLAMINMQEQEIEAYTEYDDRRKRSLQQRYNAAKSNLDSSDVKEIGISSHIEHPKLQQDCNDMMTQRKEVYLGLETLSPGDMFGFNDLSATAIPGPSSVCVISEGTEVILINKRFFRNHAGTTTMLKLETMIRDFIDEDQANSQFTRQEMWTRYKEAMMNKIPTAHRRDHEETIKPNVGHH